MCVKKRLIFLLTILLISSLCGGCSKASDDDFTPEQLVINTPSRRYDGNLTVKDSNANVYFEYNGNIDILNDGKNGEAITVDVVIDGIDDSGGSVATLIYDKDKKAISQYIGQPQIMNGVLVLKNAKQTYLERDIEWEE